MKFREYREEDANEILKWIKNEREFRLWSADRYKEYPILPSDINENYKECRKTNEFYPMSLTEHNQIMGHLIFRKIKENNIRLGFIIVNSEMRNKGYGKKLILKTIKYVKEKFNPDEIELGVFTNNINAINCYKACGFEITKIEKGLYQFENEKWDCAEMRLKNK